MFKRVLPIACLMLLCVCASEVNAENVGYASYYSHGARTASGERFDPNGMTAAHRSLAFGTRVQVKSLTSGRSVVVRINDRGPFIRSRIIDLSLGAAKKLGIAAAGVARVSIKVIN